MNPAVRAVVRAAHQRGVPIYAIYEGYQGLVDGGDNIRPMGWDDVGGILHRGGTVVGTARCKEFTTREGRRRAALNLVSVGIDGLVVIGGDGSLTGASRFQEEWPSLLGELVERGELSQDVADAHPHLQVVGLVGSIDNDMFGTDMTIGADTALHRIVEAVDAITSTAASHQRTFVVEVMGRHCGYLALMTALATGADWVLLPENPPRVDDWEGDMCRALRAGHDAGRRHSMVIVAEGAQDRYGKRLTAQYIRDVLEHRLGSDCRLTMLGHVQRGGAPSAFDRFQSTVLGHDAVSLLLDSPRDSPPLLLGLRENRVASSPLMSCVEKTHEVARAVEAGDSARAMELRGGSFREAWSSLRTILRATPRDSATEAAGLRIGVMHCGGPAPGMNTAVRAAVRLGIEAGHTMLGIRNGFRGLLEGDVFEMGWMSVHGWVAKGGAELGISRKVPDPEEVAQVAHRLEELGIEALLMIGGWAGYEGCYDLHSARDRHGALDIPIVCLPASINNNLPGSEHSIGADTALNTIVADVDKLKQSAVATHRCYIVEVMGKDCGYLALFSGLATGAERVYIPEEAITLADLQDDVANLVTEFERGKRLGLLVRNERADESYTTDFLVRLFDKEGGDLFDVRQTILGHVQQGGNPSPFDRIQAIRLARAAIERLSDREGRPEPLAVALGLQAGTTQVLDLATLHAVKEDGAQRPAAQWWMRVREIARNMAHARDPAEREPAS